MDWIWINVLNFNLCGSNWWYNVNVKKINMIDFYSDFKNFSADKLGISSMDFHYWEKAQERIYSSVTVPLTIPQGNNTPYILEERKMRYTQIDIFSRMMAERILWVTGPVNDYMSSVVSAQLMWLDMDSDSDVTMHIDSPGGSVKSGLTIVDTMNYISSDISTINVGMAASMGSILLGNGTKGKRHALQNSRVMLHQVSSGASGHIEDMKISIEQAERYNRLLFGLLSDYCDKDKAKILIDCNRDNWLDANESKAYGIIDSVISKKKKKK